MDAAAKAVGWRAYVFFYIYRLVMTLVVLPILVSFMMNAFIGGVVRILGPSCPPYSHLSALLSLLLYYLSLSLSCYNLHSNQLHSSFLLYSSLYTLPYPLYLYPYPYLYLYLYLYLHYE